MERALQGYFWIVEAQIVGFTIIRHLENVNDVAEFYIIPSYRKRGAGEAMAQALFEIYPGNWQVKQIDGADGAKSFWRRVIGRFTSGDFEEVTEKDTYWCVVTCQKFRTENFSPSFSHNSGFEKTTPRSL